jgi:tetratricopeptide (TPR) repeat protein
MVILMKLFHSWILVVLIASVLIAPQTIAAVYGNLASILLSHRQAIEHQKYSEQIITYYQSSRELWPSDHSQFRLVYANYLITGSSMFVTDDLKVARFLELAGGYLQRDLLSDAQVWARYALMVEEQSDAYCYLGQVALAEGHLNLAVSYYRQAWQLDKFLYPINRVQCAYNLTWIYYREKNWAEGDIWLEKYKLLLDGNLLVQDWRELGRLNLMGGRIQRVRELFDYAVGSMPDNPWIYASFTALYLEEDLVLDALRVCQAAPSEIKTDNSLLRQCGRVFYVLEDWDQAAIIYQEVVDQNPDNVWAYYRLADIHMQLDRLDLAYFYATQSHKLAPEDLSVSLAVGLLYEKLGHSTVALDVYYSALEAHPGDDKLKEAISRLAD